MRLPDPLVVAYLAAVAAANLLVSRFGPSLAVVNALLLIGLDLFTRDALHERWQGKALWPRMLALVGAGGVLSLVLGGSGRVAVASCVSFVLAGAADSASYSLLRQRPRLWRVNGSNLVAAAVDSLCFPALVFGWPALWSVVVGQFLAKVVGGALWAALLLHRPQRARHEARP